MNFYRLLAETFMLLSSLPFVVDLLSEKARIEINPWSVFGDLSSEFMRGSCGFVSVPNP